MRNIKTYGNYEILLSIFNANAFWTAPFSLITNASSWNNTNQSNSIAIE